MQLEQIEMPFKDETTLSQEEINDFMVEYLARTNRPEFNITKLCEELSELQEKLLKYINKKKSARPSVEDITEEIGDVVVRTNVLVEMFNIEEKVQKRYDYKSNQLYNWYRQGKYKGGL